MICARCGARLQGSDQFCPECGAKVIKERRCPDCGAVLREGTKFCHKCGRLVERTNSSSKVSEETLDIPIETIERTIVAETEAKVMAERGDEEVIHRKPVSRPSQSNQMKRSEQPPRKKKAVNEMPPGKKKAVNEMPPRKKRAVEEMPSGKRKPVYREDEDWDDWDDDEEEEGADVITIMTAVVGCVLLVVVAFLAFNLYRQYVPKDYEKVQEQQLEEQEEQEEEGKQQETASDENETISYTLVVVSNVNVRDNPSTEGTNVLKVAKAGESYECYGSVEDGNWYEIRLEDGTTGYVFKDYVTIQE